MIENNHEPVFSNTTPFRRAITDGPPRDRTCYMGVTQKVIKR